MEKETLKKYRIAVDIWLGLGVLALVVCIYIFIVMSAEMYDYCTNDKIREGDFLRPVYDYAGCVLNWPSFFGELLMGIQLWFSFLYFRRC